MKSRQMEVDCWAHCTAMQRICHALLASYTPHSACAGFPDLQGFKLVFTNQ